MIYHTNLNKRVENLEKGVTNLNKEVSSLKSNTGLLHSYIKDLDRIVGISESKDYKEASNFIAGNDYDLEMKNVTPVKNYFESTDDEMKLDDQNENHNQNSIPKSNNSSTYDTIKRSSDSFSHEESSHEENLCQNENEMFQHDSNDRTRTIVHDSMSILSLGLVQENDLMKKNINEINDKISNLGTRMSKLETRMSNLETKMEENTTSLNNLSAAQEKTMKTVETLMMQFNKFLEHYKKERNQSLIP